MFCSLADNVSNKKAELAAISIFMDFVFKNGQLDWQSLHEKDIGTIYNGLSLFD